MRAEEGGVKAVSFQVMLLSGKQLVPVAPLGAHCPSRRARLALASGELRSAQSVRYRCLSPEVVWCSFDSEKQNFTFSLQKVGFLSSRGHLYPNYLGAQQLRDALDPTI